MPGNGLILAIESSCDETAAAIVQRGHRLGFLKPVGQRYLVVEGTRADEDAVLMKEVFGLPDALNDMSPVTLPRHFTTDFVMGRIHEDLDGAIQRVAARDQVLDDGLLPAAVGGSWAAPSWTR